MKIDDRVAIVTGAGRGIGAGIAMRLAAHGAVVVPVDLDEASLEDTARRARASGGRAEPAVVDVTSEDDVADLVDGVASRLGPVAILVNNAGIYLPEQPVTEVALADWDRILRVNLTSQFVCARAVVPSMADQGHGRIVNIASRAWLGSAGLAAYTASKGGVISLTRTLAIELGPSGITVNAVSPTTIRTPLFERMPPQEQAVVESRVAGQPIARLGTPEDVACAVHFLASDDAAYITGQHLYVGGGTELRGSGIL